MADKTFTTATLSSADVNTYLSHTGGAWGTWTPTVSQGVGVTCTVTAAARFKAGRFMRVYASLAITSSGSAGQPIEIQGLPAAAGVSGLLAGEASVFDSSAGLGYSALLYITGAGTKFDFRASGLALPADTRLGVYSFTDALAAGDSILFRGDYETV